MQHSCKRFIQLTMVVVLASLAFATSARANVYATSIKLNGSTNNVAISGGQSVSISYILNEPASAGVTVKILSGATAVRTIVIAAGNPGTMRGTNTVVWNGNNDAGVGVPSGTYSFSVTAASAGYPVWTQTTSDDNPGNQAWQPWGLAVNQNTNSFYYGRVFVANSYPGPTTTNTADLLGFQKLNADGSPAEEGIYSSGGYPWTGSFSESPFRARVGADDRFYAEDWSANGAVMSWDQEISTNSLLYVMGDDNNPGGNFGGFYLSGSGSDRKLWMTDNTAGGLGAYMWNFQTNGVLATNYLGTQVIPVGGDLADSAFDIALDKNGKIYVVVQPVSPSPATYQIMRFPAYSGTAVTNADWKVDTQSDANDKFAVAVSPDANYVAVALSVANSVLILDAATGTTVTNISDNGFAHHAVAWDNVGNVYTSFDVNQGESAWQAWSPPGANQATTVGLETIQVQQSTSQPQIISIVPSGSKIIITFTGPAGDPASYYSVLGGSNVNGVTNVIPAVITGSNGLYQATVLAGGASQYYRIDRSTVPVVTSPVILSIVPSGTHIIITFTGPAGDPTSYYSVLGGSSVNGVTNVIPAVITGGNGLYQATILAGGPSQYYRIDRSTVPVVSSPVITSILPSGLNYIIRFIGSASDSASAYSVVSGTAISGVTNTTAAVMGGSGGAFQATVAASAPRQFYRIKR